MKRTALVAGAALLFITITYGLTSAQTVEVELLNAQGEKVGSGTLVQQPAGVRISLQVRNLTPGPHGFHIHAIGKCDPPDFTSAGGHFNPEGKKHGLKNPAGPHAGDLPNIVVKPDGTAVADVVASTITFGPGNRSLSGPQGTALVIHANPDDELTDPAGGAGPRIACGVIGPR